MSDSRGKFTDLDDIRALPNDVTPRMIQAGMDAYQLWLGSKYEQASPCSIQNLTSYVYRAMRAAQPRRVV